MLRRACARGGFYRAFVKLAAAALGAIRLREHADDFVVRAQRLQRGNCETGRAGECDAQT